MVFWVNFSENTSKLNFGYFGFYIAGAYYPGGRGGALFGGGGGALFGGRGGGTPPIEGAEPSLEVGGFSSNTFFSVIFSSLSV